MSAFSDQVLLSPQFDEVAYLQYILHTGGYQNQEEVDRLQRCIDTVHRQMAVLIQDHREDVLHHAQVVYKAQGDVEALRQTAQSLERVRERLRFMIQDPYETIQTHLMELENTNRAAEILSHVSKFLALMKKLQNETSTPSNTTTTTTTSNSPTTVVFLQQARTMRELDVLLRTASEDIRGIHVVEAQIPLYDKAAAQLRHTMTQLLQMNALCSSSSAEATTTSSAAAAAAVPHAVVADVGLALMGAHVLERLMQTTVEFMAERRRSVLRCIARELQPSAISEARTKVLPPRGKMSSAGSSSPSSSSAALGEAFLHQLHRTMHFVSQQTHCVLVYWRVLLSKADPITNEPYLSSLMREQHRQPEPHSASHSATTTLTRPQQNNNNNTSNNTSNAPQSGTASTEQEDPAQLVAEYLVSVLDKFREMVHQVQSHPDWAGTELWSLIYSRYLNLLHQFLVSGVAGVPTSTDTIMSKSLASSAGAGGGAGATADGFHSGARGCGLADMVDLLQRLDEEVTSMMRATQVHLGRRTDTRGLLTESGAANGLLLLPGSRGGGGVGASQTLTAANYLPPSVRERFFRGWLMDMTAGVRQKLLQCAFSEQRELMKPVLTQFYTIVESAQANPKLPAAPLMSMSGLSTLNVPNSNGSGVGHHQGYASSPHHRNAVSAAGNVGLPNLLDFDMNVYMRKTAEFLSASHPLPAPPLSGQQTGRPAPPPPTTTSAAAAADPYGCSLRLFSILDGLQQWAQSVESARRRFPLPPQPSITSTMTRDQLVHIGIANACTAVLDGLRELLKDAVDPALSVLSSASSSRPVTTTTGVTAGSSSSSGTGIGGSHPLGVSGEEEDGASEAMALLQRHTTTTNNNNSGGSSTLLVPSDIAGARDMREAANLLVRLSEVAQLRWQRMALEQLRDTFQRLHDASAIPFLDSVMRLVQEEYLPRCATTDMRLEMLNLTTTIGHPNTEQQSITGNPPLLSSSSVTPSAAASVTPLSSLYPQLQRVAEHFRSHFYLAFHVRNPTWVAASRQVVNLLLSGTIAHALLHPPVDRVEGPPPSPSPPLPRRLYASRAGVQQFLKGMSAVLPVMVDHLRLCGVPRSTILLQGMLKQLELLYATLAADGVMVSTSPPSATTTTTTMTATTTTTTTTSSNAQTLLSLMQRLPPLLSRLFLLQQFIWELQLDQEAEAPLSSAQPEPEADPLADRTRWPMCLWSTSNGHQSAAASHSSAPWTSATALEQALQMELFQVAQGGGGGGDATDSSNNNPPLPLSMTTSLIVAAESHTPADATNTNTTAAGSAATNTTSPPTYSATALALHHAIGNTLGAVGGALPAEALFRTIWKDM